MATLSDEAPTDVYDAVSVDGERVLDVALDTFELYEEGSLLVTTFRVVGIDVLGLHHKEQQGLTGPSIRLYLQSQEEEADGNRNRD